MFTYLTVVSSVAGRLFIHDLIAEFIKSLNYVCVKLFFDKSIYCCSAVNSSIVLIA